MKEMVIKRKIDEMGRIVLPVRMRRMMGIGIGTELQIEYADQKIIIKIPDEACQLCGSNHDLISYNGSNICRACVKKLQAVLEKDK